MAELKRQIGILLVSALLSSLLTSALFGRFSWWFPLVALIGGYLETGMRTLRLVRERRGLRSDIAFVLLWLPTMLLIAWSRRR